MKQAVLLYDRDCGFCRWSVNKVVAWDRNDRIRPLALQEPEADRLLAGIEPASRITSWHLATPDGRVHSAGAAAAPLMELLPGGAPLARLFARFPGATERAYRWVARNRDYIGHAVGVACSITPAARRRDE